MANRTSRRGSGRRARAPRAVAASTTKLIDALRSACETLDELGVDFALVGGLAVSARAEPRLTRDVDLAIATDDDDGAESLTCERRRLTRAAPAPPGARPETRTATGSEERWPLANRVGDYWSAVFTVNEPAA